MLSTIIGSIVLSSDVPLPTSGPIMFVLGGILLMIVNTFALMALWYRQWRWLLVSEGIFAFLLVAIYATSIVAICLALELESPIAEAINKAWDQGTVFKTEMHQNWCLQSDQHDELRVCSQWKNQMTRQLMDPARDEVQCPHTRLQIAANCSLIDPDHNELQADACAPGASEGVQAQLFEDCQTCDQACRETFIDDIANDLYPVSIVAYVMCFVVAVTATWNSFIVLEHATRKDDNGNVVPVAIEGMWAVVSYVLNGTVCISGALLMAISLLLISDANADCREQAGPVADLDCAEPSKSFVAMVLLGICLSVCALVSTIGVQKTAIMKANFMWVNLLRITQVVYSVLGMLMLAAAV